MRALASVVMVTVLAFVTPSLGAPAGITIVAAENVYGDVAQQVAGPYANVTSILSNPNQDPHLFEADPGTARALSRARIVIANGADYDPWMEKLLDASKATARTEIVVADLVGKKSGDNPHLWYDPAVIQALAERLAAALSAADPAHKADYDQGAQHVIDGLAPLRARIAAIKAQHAGQPVTASEPVFGYMAEALGLDMHNRAFQTAVMNGTEPSPADVAAFEDDLKTHKVRAMLYNSQADDGAVKRLVGIAKQAGVPVVGVSETEPAGKHYAAWMLDQLNDLDRALASGRS